MSKGPDAVECAIILIGVVVSAFCGYRAGYERAQTEAIQADKAEWATGEDGKPKWRWKACP